MIVRWSAGHLLCFPRRQHADARKAQLEPHSRDHAVRAGHLNRVLARGRHPGHDGADCRARLGARRGAGQSIHAGAHQECVPSLAAAQKNS
jgi:hypothetical protein